MKKKIIILGAMMIAAAAFTLYTSSVSQTDKMTSLLTKNIQALSAGESDGWVQYRHQGSRPGYCWIDGREIPCHLPCCTSGSEFEKCDVGSIGNC